MKPAPILFSFLVTIIFLVTIAGCAREKGCTDPTAINYNQNARQDNGTCKYNGTATFYSLNSGPTATVTINGQTAIASQFFTTAVNSCNTQGCANFTLPAGNYNYTASSSLFDWSGSITVDPNGCSLIELDNPNTTFYSPTFVSNITVTIAGQSDTIKQLFTSSPGCSVGGCANFFLTTGNYSYTATDGVNHWSGTIPIDETTCNSISLQ